MSQPSTQDRAAPNEANGYAVEEYSWSDVGDSGIPSPEEIARQQAEKGPQQTPPPQEPPPQQEPPREPEPEPTRQEQEPTSPPAARSEPSEGGGEGTKEPEGDGSLATADRPRVEQALEQLRNAELSQEQIDELRQNPILRQVIDTQANYRFGNLKQKWEQEREQEERQRRQEEEQWSRATDYYNEIMGLEKSDPDKFVAALKDPGIRDWVTQYERLAEERKAKDAATQVDVDGVKRQALEEVLPVWNQAAAQKFGEVVKSSLGDDRYAKLPSRVRQAIEAGTALSEDTPWVQDYVSNVISALDKVHEEELQAKEEDVRTQMRAELERSGPVMMTGRNGQSMDADEVLARYMDFGTDVEAGGVPFDAYERAKRQKGLEV